MENSRDSLPMLTRAGNENEEESEEGESKTAAACLKRHLAAFGTLLAVFSAGTPLGLLTPFLNQPNPQHNDIPWKEPMTGVFIVLGGLSTIYLAKRMGRRRTLLLGTSINALAWMLMAADVTSKLTVLSVIGRLLASIQFGLVFITGLIYVTEILTAKTRSLWLTAIVFSQAVGRSLVYVYLDFELNWIACAFSCAALSSISFMILLFLPDSPSWLLYTGHPKAKEAILNFFGEVSTTDPHNPTKAGYKECIKPLITLFSLSILINLSALMAAHGITYTGAIADTIQVKFSSFFTAMTLRSFIFQISAVSSTFFLAWRCFRRCLLIISALAMSVSFVLLGVTCFFVSCNMPDHDDSILGILALLPIAATTYWNRLLWQLYYILSCELFKFHVRPTGVALAFVLDHAGSYLSLFEIKDGVPYWTHFIFGGIIAIAAFLVRRYLLTTETKNKTISELDGRQTEEMAIETTVIGVVV